MNTHGRPIPNSVVPRVSPRQQTPPRLFPPAVAFLVCFGAVSSVTLAAPPGPPETGAPDSVASAIYSAVIQQQYDRGLQTPLIILGESVLPPEDAPAGELLGSTLQAALSPLSAEAMAAWNRLPAAPSVLARELSVRRPFQIMTRTVKDSLFSVCQGGWDRFASMYPKSRGYVTFSPVAVDPSMNEALVYTEEYCGMWCAEGTFVFLQKEEGAWKVHRKLTLWVS